MGFGDEYGLVPLNVDSEKIELIAVDTKCNVTALLSNVETTFTYRNKFNKDLDASFTFPLDDVAVYCFEAHMKDRVLVGECRPREEAQTVFDEAVEKKHTAFLAEQSEQSEDVFRISMGNIPANEVIKIILKYVGHLSAENTTLHDQQASQAVFRLPSTITPKYSPSTENIKTEFDPFTEPSVTCHESYTFGFEASLSMPHPIKEVTSAADSFSMELDSTDNRKAKVILTSKFTCDHNLVMHIKMNNPMESFAVYEPAAQSSTTSKFLSMDCIMAECMPSSSEHISDQETRTEVIFVIDRSGSMSGQPMKCASESLLLLLKSLPMGCRFQIIGFGSSHRALFNEPLDYDETTLGRGLQYQAELSADMGGTEVLPALREAYETPLTGAGWYRQIIFVTDGDVANGNEVLGLVGANVHKARLFTIGIRTGASSHLISTLARVGRGVSAIIEDHSQLRPAVMKILRMILQPRTDEINLHWDVKYEDENGQTKSVDVISIPEVIPPVFPGQLITVYALTKPMPSLKLMGTVRFNFKLMGTEQSFTVNLSSAVTHRSSDLDKTANPLHRMAGKAQLNELGDKYKTSLMNGQKSDDPAVKQLRQQLEEVSCVVNILCPVTALVCVDPIKNSTVAPTSISPASEAWRVSSQHQPMFSAPVGGCMIGLGSYAVDAPPQHRSSGPMRMLQKLFGGGDIERSSRSSSAHILHSDVAECAYSDSISESDEVECAYLDSSSPRAAACFPGQSSPPRVEKQAVDDVIRLADLQFITGSWAMNDDLAGVVGINLEQLRSSKPDHWPSTVNEQPVSEDVWATVLAVIYLESKAQEREQEWCMFVLKARNWVRKAALDIQSDKSHLESMCEQLYEAARKLIN